ncbi:MAG: anthranilate phosphoribosyltransferase [Pirellulaceae bacterium]
MDIVSLLGRIAAGQDLSMPEMADAVDSIMRGEWDESQIALLLTSLRTKGETVPEIAGAALAMRRHMTRIPSSRTGLLDTCGTGGDASGTFNISTAAAIVTAAAGVPVAKHGNRSITSKTGSADVLQCLGVNMEASLDQCAASLDKIGICFCFAPLMHQSMRHVGPVRKKLGVPTIFNMLGPLCNPAEAEFQLLGVGKPELRPKLAEALVLLKTKRAIVVCGQDGLDEVTLCGTTWATDTTSEGTSEFTWTPADFGLPAVPNKNEMQVETAEESAAIIRGILNGKRNSCRDIVVLNSAAALWTAGAATSTVACAERAAEALDSGLAKKTLEDLVKMSHA